MREPAYLTSCALSPGEKRAIKNKFMTLHRRRNIREQRRKPALFYEQELSALTMKEGRGREFSCAKMWVSTGTRENPFHLVSFITDGDMQLSPSMKEHDDNLRKA